MGNLIAVVVSFLLGMAGVAFVKDTTSLAVLLLAMALVVIYALKLAEKATSEDGQTYIAFSLAGLVTGVVVVLAFPAVSPANVEGMTKAMLEVGLLILILR